MWKTEPVQGRNARVRSKNVLNLRPGTTRYARARVNDIKDSLLLFFPPTIESIILKWSYAKDQCGDNIEMDSNLLHAYFAVLILAGVCR